MRKSLASFAGLLFFAKCFLFLDLFLHTIYRKIYQRFSHFVCSCRCVLGYPREVMKKNRMAGGDGVYSHETRKHVPLDVRT